MKILIVTTPENMNVPFNIFVYQQAKALLSLGHNVRVISLVALKYKHKHYVNQKQLIEEDGLTIDYILYPSFSNFGVYGINSFFATHFSKIRFNNIIKDFKPDAIHAHTILLEGDVVANLTKKINIPTVLTTHGSDTFIPIMKGKGQKLVSICKKFNALIAVSKKLKSALCGLDSSLQVNVIHNGHNVIIKPDSYHKKPFSVISVGTLISRKKFDITIRAFADFYKSHPEATLIIVGDGPEMKSLVDLSHNLGLHNVVTFTGTLDNKEVYKYMAVSEYFIMPSIREGFGIVYIEAMAHGCITIGTEEEGITDIIVNGNNGFLVPKDNPQAITSLLEKCYSNTPFKKQISLNASITASKLTWAQNAHANVEIYKQFYK